MAGYDDEIERQAAKPLIPRERQHVRLVLELDRARRRLFATAKVWLAWLAGGVAIAVGIVQLFDRVFGKGGH